MSVPKYIYLGNVLGATGPIGPKGEVGASGCPQCITFNNPANIYFIHPTLSFFNFAAQSHILSCWKTNQVATVYGRLTDGSFATEALYVYTADFDRLTFSTVTKYFDKNYPITVCHGNNIGPAGPPGGPTGATGPSGLSGPSGVRGSDCKGCFGFSNSDLNLNDGSTAPGQKVTINVERGLSCLDGARIRIHDKTIDSISFLEGTVDLYENDKLTIAVDYRNGSSRSTSWSFGIAGLIGSRGPVGATGPEMNLINAENRQIIFNDLGEPRGANLFFKTENYGNGGLESRLGLLTSTPEATLDISGSLKIRKVDSVSWPYN